MLPDSVHPEPERIWLPGWCLGGAPLAGLIARMGPGRVLELPGYGSDPDTTTPFVSDFDQAVERLAERLPTIPGGVPLAGWSLGALVALAIAARHPTKVASLFLIAATPCFCVRTDWPHGRPSDELTQFRAAIGQSQGALFDELLGRFVGSFNRGDRHARLKSRLLLATATPPPERHVLLAGLDWLANVDLCDEMASIRCPVHLWHGRADPLIPLTAAMALSSLIADCRLTVVDDSAHAPWWFPPLPSHNDATPPRLG